MVQVVKDCLRKQSEVAPADGAPRLLLVISAFGTTTRDLEHAARLAVTGDLPQAIDVLQAVAHEHIHYVHTLISEPATMVSLELLIKETGKEIRVLLEGIAVTRQLTLRTLDRVLAYGELLALHIGRHLLEDEGTKIAWADARQVVVTDEVFGCATPDIAKTQVHVNAKLIPRLNEHSCVIIQGFVGATAEGVVTTMGKESSTLTATLLGSLLGASEVRIYTDVPGVCTADPKITPDAQPHPFLSFQQAAIAAHHGLKLLYATTIEPTQRAGIPVRILSASEPNQGTLIGTTGSTFAPIIIMSEHPHGSDITPHRQDMTKVVIVLSDHAKALQYLGTLAAEYHDAGLWDVTINPTEQAIHLWLPAPSASSITSSIHSFLKDT